MAGTFHTIGSTGIRKWLYESILNPGYHVDGVAVELPLYPETPINTPYTPTTTAYLKVTPDATNLSMYVRARTQSDDLIWAGIVTHKIGDTTTIAASDATNLATSKTLIDEIAPECKVHIASTTYHIAAGTVLWPGHKAADTTNTNSAAGMNDLATGYVLADEQDDDYNAHAPSTTYHIAAGAAVDFGGTPDSEATLVTKVNLLRTAMIAHYASTTVHYVADYENNRLATATTAATDTASAQTLINLLKTYWNSHCGIGAAAAADLAAVICHANAVRAGLLIHYAATDTHGGIADATNLATLTAVPVASDLATAQTLITAEKNTLNLHYVIDDNDAYQTEPAGVALEWDCAGTFFCRTSTSGGTFVTTEKRSA